MANIHPGAKTVAVENRRPLTESDRADGGAKDSRASSRGRLRKANASLRCRRTSEARTSEALATSIKIFYYHVIL
jgi:hypothetical protein